MNNLPSHTQNQMYTALSALVRATGSSQVTPAPPAKECTCLYHSGNQVDERGCEIHDSGAIIGRIMAR